MKGLLIKILILLLILVTVISASLRFSEQHGPMAQKGCIYAIGVNILAAVAGIIPFLISKKKEATKPFLALIIGASIRVLLTAIGIVVITVLAAKDRVLGHNPLAALYNADSYYEFLKK